MTADELDWVPPGVDTRRANVARVYDYLLGGTHNFLSGQDVGRAVAAVDPNIREMARVGRGCLGRVAQGSAPGSRVVYVDLDPVAVAHSKAILAGNENATVIDADLREPQQILAHERVSMPMHLRSREEIMRFFDGFELVDPGLVYIPQWRPDSPADVTGDPGRFWGLVGVARKH